VLGQYQYDALGRRVVKIAHLPALKETRFFYDGARVIEEQDTTGMTEATYVYGTWIDEVLRMERGGQEVYYHQNALGSVIGLSDSAGNVVERYRYDAYGQVTVTDGVGNPVADNAWGTAHSALGNPYMFTGRRWDEETGLYYYRARYYDGELGRFLQRDPIGVWGDEYNLGNIYAYVGNNPANRVDLLGLQQDYDGGWGKGTKDECCENVCFTNCGCQQQSEVISQPNDNTETRITPQICELWIQCNHLGAVFDESDREWVPFYHCLILFRRPSGGWDFYEVNPESWYLDNADYLTQEERIDKQESPGEFGNMRARSGPLRRTGNLARTSRESSHSLSEREVPKGKGEHAIRVAIGEHVCQWRGRLDQWVSHINSAGIDYDLLGPNSNTFVHRVIQDVANCEPQLPSGVIAPGWNNFLYKITVPKRQ
jgi:RHS repeat-associated protein